MFGNMGQCIQLEGLKKPPLVIFVYLHIHVAGVMFLLINLIMSHSYISLQNLMKLYKYGPTSDKSECRVISQRSRSNYNVTKNRVKAGIAFHNQRLYIFLWMLMNLKLIVIFALDMYLDQFKYGSEGSKVKFSVTKIE